MEDAGTAEIDLVGGEIIGATAGAGVSGQPGAGVLVGADWVSGVGAGAHLFTIRGGEAVLGWVTATMAAIPTIIFTLILDITGRITVRLLPRSSRTIPMTKTIREIRTEIRMGIRMAIG